MAGGFWNKNTKVSIIPKSIREEIYSSVPEQQFASILAAHKHSSKESWWAYLNTKAKFFNDITS